MWPDRLTVLLGAQSVAAISEPYGLNRGVIEQQHISIAWNDEEPAWRDAVGKLESLMASMQVKPKTRLRVILSSDFVRYLVLPPQPIPMSSTEKSAYAAAAYKDVHGTVTEGWDIRLHDVAPNQATIAAAVDKKLIETLKQISFDYQLKLVSIQPYLMSAFNSLRSHLGKMNGYLVIFESWRLLVINMHQGRYQNLRTSLINGDWKTELKHLLTRESLLGADNGRDVLIYAPAHKITTLNNFDGWNIQVVGQAHKKAAIDSPFALLEAVA